MENKNGRLIAQHGHFSLKKTNPHNSTKLKTNFIPYHAWMISMIVSGNSTPAKKIPTQNTF